MYHRYIKYVPCGEICAVCVCVWVGGRGRGSGSVDRPGLQEETSLSKAFSRAVKG